MTEKIKEKMNQDKIREKVDIGDISDYKIDLKGNWGQELTREKIEIGEIGKKDWFTAKNRKNEKPKNRKKQLKKNRKKKLKKNRKKFKNQTHKS